MAAIALLIAAQLISAVAEVVWSLRFGNPVPFILIIVSTVALLRLTKRQDEDTITERLLNILSLVSVGFLMMVVFVASLGLGVYFAIFAGAMAVIGCKAVYDTDSLRGSFSSITNGEFSLGGSRSFHRNPDADETVLMNDLEQLHLEVILVEKKYREVIIALLKERPLLPWSLSCLENVDALVIVTNGERNHVTTAIKLLDQAKVPYKSVSPALQRLILALPLLDRKYGIQLTDYHIVKDSLTVDRLIELGHTRLTIHPDGGDLLVIIPEFIATGMQMQQIQASDVVSVVLRRDLSQVTKREEEDVNTT
jgi:hypothetical protein